MQVFRQTMIAFSLKAFLQVSWPKVVKERARDSIIMHAFQIYCVIFFLSFFWSHTTTTTTETKIEQNRTAESVYFCVLTHSQDKTNFFAFHSTVCWGAWWGVFCLVPRECLPPQHQQLTTRTICWSRVSVGGGKRQSRASSRRGLARGLFSVSFLCWKVWLTCAFRPPKKSAITGEVGC